MIFEMIKKSAVGTILITASLTAGAIVPVLVSQSEIVFAAQETAPVFSDIATHWAQPFIRKLAENNIVAGYPDNTFRPNQPVDRDEFAAIIDQAFNQPVERPLPRGSVYNDVPVGYWAAPAIESAYQMGFMRGYEDGDFRPNQPITRVEALVALSNNLNLDIRTPVASQTVRSVPNTVPNTLSNTTVVTAPVQQASAVPAATQRPQRRFMYPIAMTLLLQPFMTTPAIASDTPNQPVNQPVNQSVNQPEATTPTPPVRTAPLTTTPGLAARTVSNYYQDSEQIPDYAVNAVFDTTTAKVVVNYPNPKILNPNQPATRGEIAAFIHQVLVNQGKIAPLASNIDANNYIVKLPENNSGQ